MQEPALQYLHPRHPAKVSTEHLLTPISSLSRYIWYTTVRDTCFGRLDTNNKQDNGVVTLNLRTQAPPNYKAISLIFSTIYLY